MDSNNSSRNMVKLSSNTRMDKLDDYSIKHAILEIENMHIKIRDLYNLTWKLSFTIWTLIAALYYYSFTSKFVLNEVIIFAIICMHVIFSSAIFTMTVIYINSIKSVHGTTILYLGAEIVEKKTNKIVVLKRYSNVIIFMLIQIIFSIAMGLFGAYGFSKPQPSKAMTEKTTAGSIIYDGLSPEPSKQVPLSKNKSTTPPDSNDTSVKEKDHE